MSTKIEWTDEVWNVVTGCTHSGSPGCDNCYARRLFPRVYGNDMVPCTADEARSIEPDTRQICVDVGADAFLRKRKFSDVRTHPERIDQPLHWRKPRRVFVCSMGDLWNPNVPDDFIEEVFSVMALADHHTFQILTKWPERMREFLTDDKGRYHWAMIEGRAQRRHHECTGEDPSMWLAVHGPLPNVWLGASASTQPDLERVMRDLPHVPAAVRFLSLEPLLEAIDIGSAVGVNWVYSAGAATVPHPSGDGRGGWWVSHGLGELPGDPPKIDWIVCGGESGPNARRCDIAWLRSVAEQCKAAGVACFLKQIGSNPGRKLGKVWHPWCHGKGKHNDMADFPKDLRVREMP